MYTYMQQDIAVNSILKTKKITRYCETYKSVTGINEKFCPCPLLLKIYYCPSLYYFPIDIQEILKTILAKSGGGGHLPLYLRVAMPLPAATDVNMMLSLF